MGLISRVSSRTYKKNMAEQDKIPNPNDAPILDPVIPDPAKWETPPNPALKFFYDPANANLIALFGWGAIISFLYIYVYGTPKLFSKNLVIKTISNRNLQVLNSLEKSD